MGPANGELIREVYAQFGLCVYHIQCIERSLAISITQQILAGRKISSAQYSYELSRIFGNTLGQLFAVAKKEGISFPPEISNQCDHILERRNHIIHDYWWHNAGKSVHDEGFQMILTELKTVNEQFVAFDDLISRENEAYIQAKGIDEKKMEQIFRDIVEGRRKVEKPHRLLRKKETITNCYIYMVDVAKRNALLVVELEDHILCTVGDNGFVPIEVESTKLEKIKKMEEYLPADANLRPNVGEFWSYYIDLATRVRFKVFSKKPSNGIIWEIEYPK